VAGRGGKGRLQHGAARVRSAWLCRGPKQGPSPMPRLPIHISPLFPPLSTPPPLFLSFPLFPPRLSHPVTSTSKSSYLPSPFFSPFSPLPPASCRSSWFPPEPTNEVIFCLRKCRNSNHCGSGAGVRCWSPKCTIVVVLATLSKNHPITIVRYNFFRAQPSHKNHREIGASLSAARPLP